MLATETAKAGANGDYVRAHHPEFEFVPIPEGRDEAEAWRLFQVIAETIPASSRVIFDITHGLRSLPMLGFLALSYLRVVKDIQVERVLYGALELTPREEGALTPVIDLTPLVMLLDWAQASEEFLRTGDARPMTALMDNQNMESLAPLRRPLEDVSAALAFQRPAQTAQMAEQLRKELQKAKKADLEHPVVTLMLDHIEDRFAGIAHGSDAFSARHEQVLLGQFAQMKFYVRGGQYAQATELAYEWMRSIQMWRLGRPSKQNLWVSAKRPRELADSSMRPMEQWQDFRRVRNRIRDLRNAFAHFNEYKSQFGEQLEDPRACPGKSKRLF
ncbi:TIGR02221 family CRISPR-associated protein [Deinococcus radiophilus]|uniref:TIGR02221 family CRISPR-associated protein n=1 Tax=Deinococcus radiophilus TaxID=32062 RepID=UPI0036150360